MKGGDPFTLQMGSLANGARYFSVSGLAPGREDELLEIVARMRFEDWQRAEADREAATPASGAAGTEGEP